MKGLELLVLFLGYFSAGHQVLWIDHICPVNLNEKLGVINTIVVELLRIRPAILHIWMFAVPSMKTGRPYTRSPFLKTIFCVSVSKLPLSTLTIFSF